VGKEPMTEKRHVLLAVCGKTAAVITEAFYYLRVMENIPVKKIVVVTTQLGKENLIRELLETHPNNARPVFDQLCLDYNFDRSSVHFDKDSIFVAKDQEDWPTEDAVEKADLGYFSDLINDIVLQLSQNLDNTIHACISGGRKTMSFYLGVSMMENCDPDDRIFSINVHRDYQKCIPKFYYPTVDSQKAKVEKLNGIKDLDFKEAKLIPTIIPFMKLKRILPLDRELPYDERVNLYQKTLNEPFTLNKDFYPGLFPKDEKMQKILFRVQQVHPTETILLTGESGTGKEVMAKFIHSTTVGSDRPFLSMNLAGEDPGLINSKLFGHLKGSFTGAISDTPGIIEDAKGGTVLLDEIDKMDKSLQPKLLRLLSEGKYSPIGSHANKVCECKIIVASGKELDNMVASNSFYPDLYYRISRFRFDLPPLRERTLDILPLARHFMEMANKKYQKEFELMDPDLRNYLLNKNWQGNIRVLMNEINNLVTFNSGKILKYEFTDDAKKTGRDGERIRFDIMLKRLLENSLAGYDGNVTQTAKYLGLKPSTLQSKIRKLGIDLSQFRRKQ